MRAIGPPGVRALEYSHTSIDQVRGLPAGAMFLAGALRPYLGIGGILDSFDARPMPGTDLRRMQAGWEYGGDLAPPLAVMRRDRCPNDLQ